MKFILKLLGLFLLGGVIQWITKIVFEWVGMNDWDNGYYTGFVTMIYLGVWIMPFVSDKIDNWFNSKS